MCSSDLIYLIVGLLFNLRKITKLVTKLWGVRERERNGEKEREIGSSYIWCNLTRVTLFLDRRFLIDLMVKKIALNAIDLHIIYLINSCFFSLSLLII